jgi:Zn-dependent protease/CBS domain-containing protein
MNPTLTIGRVAGIRIGINWSWLLAFALIGWTLGANAFPAQSPGRSNTVYAVMAVVATLVFFCSILLHELGHALRARKEGVEIEGITLWLFGGVARFKTDFPSAGAELRIALAGPFVTLALAAAFIGSGLALGSRTAIGGVAAWLGYINALLLVFNLMPAFPLDGGRVLRALLWRRSGDLAAATVRAAAIGRGLAYGLIGLGVFAALTVDYVSGLWLVFLGWFISAAATAEVQHSILAAALGGIRVRDVMVSQPVTVDAGWTLAEFVEEVGSRYHYTTYPVVDGWRVAGLLPLAAVLRTPHADWPVLRIRDCMLPLADTPSVGEDDRLIDALAVLNPVRLGRALVRRGNLVVGLLSITDVGPLVRTR